MLNYFGCDSLNIFYDASLLTMQDTRLPTYCSAACSSCSTARSTSCIRKMAALRDNSRRSLPLKPSVLAASSFRFTLSPTCRIQIKHRQHREIVRTFYALIYHHIDMSCLEIWNLRIVRKFYVKIHMYDFPNYHDRQKTWPKPAIRLLFCTKMVLLCTIYFTMLSIPSG